MREGSMIFVPTRGHHAVLRHLDELEKAGRDADARVP